MPDSDIERRIATGSIVSTDFLRRLRSFWKDDYLESTELARIVHWSIEYFEKYKKAPGRHIEDIYLEELRKGVLDKAEAEYTESVFARLADDYDRGDQFNADYLFDRTTDYCREREILHHNERVQDLIERGDVRAADAAALAYRSMSWATDRGLEVGSEEGLRRLGEAFTSTTQPVLSYPGALGTMLNQHLVRDGFVGFTGSEKRGKTWIMLDIAVRALRQRSNVAFFQAGDLTEGQFLRRIGIHIAGRSDTETYCRAHWRPIGDCVFNQINECTRGDRNCTFGVFEETVDGYKSNRLSYTSYDELVKAAEDNPDYRPCDSAGCGRRWPAVWLVEEPETMPLTGRSAQRVVGRFFERYRRRFKLATYASGMLDISEVESCLDEWERADDFVPDVIVVDYADLMTARASDFRHMQNEIWKGLRSLSQKKHALVVTATQADAASYRANSLTMSNFSEDKRKFAHVTAMFGLNQSPDGREKQLGIMRINELVVREGAALQTDVTVLQDLRRGRPCLESFSVGIRPDRVVDL